MQEQDLNSAISNSCAVLELCDLTGDVPCWKLERHILPEIVDLTLDDHSIDADTKPTNFLMNRHDSRNSTCVQELSTDETDWMEISDSDD